MNMFHPSNPIGYTNPVSPNYIGSVNISSSTTGSSKTLAEEYPNVANFVGTSCIILMFLLLVSVLFLVTNIKDTNKD